MSSLIQLNKPTPLLLVGLVLACFALLPRAQAVSPAPDGGYPGGNTAEGDSALFSLTSGIDNTALGFQALYHNNGNYNTAEGFGALYSNTSGSQNTANGVNTLLSNTTGAYNTADGVNSLYHNTIGNGNTANGASALFSNRAGNGNTAIGQNALLSNRASNNTADGVNALQSNTQGNENTANGSAALLSNTTGNRNTANGSLALFNTTGSQNTADGEGALYYNTTGNNNIALGINAGNGVTTANNVICIGAPGNNVDNACYIGKIFGATSSGGTAVFINSNGRLGTMTSSARFKDEIKSMGRASEPLFALKPVSFRYKKEIDPAGTPQLGLVAEDVEKVNPDLIVRDEEGKPYSVRYDQVTAMLLHEFLKEHRKVEEQDCKLQEQGATIARRQKQIESLTAGLQKVSDQLELSRPASQTVKNTD